jgi:hypothetical protein
MSNATVRQLALTLPRTVSPHGAQARAEDALRCAGDDPRLLLLRRLSLGVLPSRGGRTLQADWTARTRRDLRAAAAAAVHAMTPGAEARDNVYFNDALEARTLLIRLLAAGRRPSGWFWRLAVPEWTGAAWPDAAARLLPDLVARPGGSVALARAVRRLIADRNLASLLSPVTARLVVMLLPTLAGARPAPSASAPSAEVPDATGGAPIALRKDAVIPMRAPLVAARAPPQRRVEISAVEPAARAAAKRVLATLGPAEAAALRTEFLRRSPDDPVVLWLAAQVVLDREPVLASAATVVIAVAHELRAMIVQAPPELVAEPRRKPVAAAETATPSSPARALSREQLATTAAAKAPPQRPAVEPSASIAMEHPSEGAGLFLLVRPLILLGLPQWLDAHPREALGAFGWAIFAAILARTPVVATDPVWRVLPEAEASADALTAWRVGLDRWLRRRARVRLADVVRRPGWFTFADGATLVRFRLASADIRVRRLALDVDPGWVPWLGHAIRFAYDDHPLVGVERP